ncbi:hypothetical protein HPB52_000159 [Rhipicephalus sanguineus]|uniref:Anoctamin dimerisation domain-containing protein n=1 Tax=Rhipicephalus sanguineus TaxID=34632 RepID=A0A9D4SPT1_RHISA|nr:hypothetical protein HPB52_000159 [Rhipicephalus sanguineus]
MAEKPAPTRKELEERLAKARERLANLGARLAFKGRELDEWVKEELWRNKETRALLKQLEEAKKRDPADADNKSQPEVGPGKRQPSIEPSLKTAESEVSRSKPAPSATTSKKTPEKPVKPGTKKPEAAADDEAEEGAPEAKYEPELAKKVTKEVAAIQKRPDMTAAASKKKPEQRQEKDEGKPRKIEGGDKGKAGPGKDDRDNNKAERGKPVGKPGSDKDKPAKDQASKGKPDKVTQQKGGKDKAVKERAEEPPEDDADDDVDLVQEDIDIALERWLKKDTTKVKDKEKEEALPYGRNVKKGAKDYAAQSEKASTLRPKKLVRIPVKAAKSEEGEKTQKASKPAAGTPGSKEAQKKTLPPKKPPEKKPPAKPPAKPPVKPPVKPSVKPPVKPAMKPKERDKSPAPDHHKTEGETEQATPATLTDDQRTLFFHDGLRRIDIVMAYELSTNPIHERYRRIFQENLIAEGLRARD